MPKKAKGKKAKAAKPAAPSNLVYATVVFSKEQSAAIDEARGKTPLSRFIRDIVVGRIGRAAKKAAKPTPEASVAEPAAVPQAQPQA